jgi:hypothetical protein
VAGDGWQGVVATEVGGWDQVVGELVVEGRSRRLDHDLGFNPGEAEAMGEDRGGRSSVLRGCEKRSEDPSRDRLERGDLRSAHAG